MLTFTSPGLVVAAPVQFVGSYRAEDNNWVWAWGNPDFNRMHTRLALQVRKYGDQRDLGYLYTPDIYCSEEDAWALTALTFQLSGAKGGAYRGPGGGLAVFMIFDEPEVHRGPLS